MSVDVRFEKIRSAVSPVKSTIFALTTNTNKPQRVIILAIISIQQPQICKVKFNNKSKRKEMGNNSFTDSRNAQEHQIDPPHSMLNNTKIINKAGSLLMRAEWPFFSKQKFTMWEKEYISFLKKVFEVPSLPNVRQPLARNLLLPIHYSYTDINICSPTGIVTMEYDLPGVSLINDIEARSLRNQPYLEHQIWPMFYQLCKIVSFLQQQSVAAGDVRSENIFVDFQQQNLKLSTEVSWIGEPTFAAKIASNSDVFLGPEVLNERKHNRQLKRSMFRSNDDFSIGMTIAQCILLQDLSKVYETSGSSKILNKQKMSQLIQRLLKIRYYSFKLLMMVVGMLQAKPQSRISCHEVCQLLKHSKKQIISCLPFELTKQQFLHQIPEKYKVIDKAIGQVNARQSRSLLDCREGHISSILSIPNLSAIKNDRRPEDSTYNYDLLNLSINSNAKPPQHSNHRGPDYQQQQYNHSAFQAVRRNKYPRNTSEYNTHQTSTNSNNQNLAIENSAMQKRTAGKSRKKLEYLRLDQIWASSEAKQHPAQSRSRQQQNMQRHPANEQTDHAIQKNFSFHSPQERLNQEQKYEEAEYLTAIKKLQKDSESKSTETLLLMPSVYNVSNHPESYISYHYTKSIVPNEKAQREDKDQCISFQTKVFQFEKELPDNVMLRKKSQQCYPHQENSDIKYNQYKRNTLGGKASGRKSLQRRDR